MTNSELTKNKEPNNKTVHTTKISKKSVMTWKDVHSKLSEEKHIAKECGMVTFLLKKKNPKW